MTNKIWYALSGLAAVAVVAGCAATQQSADTGSLNADFAAMLKSSFRDDGIAKVESIVPAGGVVKNLHVSGYFRCIKKLQEISD